MPDNNNYTKSFGFQWNKLRQVQLDSCTGVPISRERFFGETGWAPNGLRGKLMLDVGCGSGRFAEVALSCGAKVVAVDYSLSVEACWQNLCQNSDLSVLQADLHSLPLRRGGFDYVYCFGVLQHTPDARKAFAALPEQVRKGGRLVVDIYPKLLLNIIWPKYWLRPLTKRLSDERLFKLVEVLVKYLLPISFAVGRIPLLGRKLRYIIPVANYKGVFPLSRSQLREWALLDTFDMLSPEHDHPQPMRKLAEWFEQGGLEEVEVFRRGFYVGRGMKPM